MLRILFRVLGILAVLLLVVAVLLAAFIPITVRRSFPSYEGEIRAPSLNAPVDIYRDEYGIPHIYAQTTYDLFFAQGYVHAQDRFWQMDFWRHIGSGRLSELFGESQLETDLFLRTLGWARIVEQELALIDPHSLSILEAYADGVNAYLTERQGSNLSLEYAILGLLNPGYQPEPWQPLHTLTWAKVMAWDLGGNLDTEIQRAILLKTLSPEQVADLFPPYPDDRPLIVTDFGGIHGSAPSDANETYTEQLLPLLESLHRQSSRLGGVIGILEAGVGSNSWAISGQLTDTGKPILANDPHLAAQMPSIWYQVGLHCTPVGPECPYEVAGFSFAGAPGIIIGQNNRIAWGFTNLGPDVMDLYIEKINPENPDQYEVNGQWVDMQVVRETILVSDGEPVELAVRHTRHGPIITETYLPEDFDEKAGIDLPPHYAIALRWTALEPNHTFISIWKINRAQNWEEFREAAALFDAPSQNLLYADVDGNIGYQAPGKIPIRAGGDGSLPVPGWTDDYEWLGTIPFEELPYALNPAEGYIVTANNAVVGPEYPYLLSLNWHYGHRAQRIVDMIEEAPGELDMAYMQRMQGDNKDLNAEALVPILIQVPLEEARLEEARRIFEGWDFQQDMDSAPGALFQAFWKHLLAETFHDDLPEDYRPGGDSRWFEIVGNLVERPQSPWWDNQDTPEVENRDDIFRLAFRKAVDELERDLGRNPDRWTWGDLHTLDLIHQSLGRSGVKPIEMLFNRGPFRTAGGSGIVNATGWSATRGYGVRSLPSMRMIVDLSDMGNTLAIHTTGQSGHAYHPHYVDMVDNWRTIQYLPLLWERQQVESAVVARLRLAP